MDVIYEDIGTPIGTFRVAEREGRVCAAAFGDRWDAVADRVEARLGRTRWTEVPTRTGDAVRRYFDGEVGALDDIPVDTVGSPFQTAVWSQLRRIGAGSTISYAELAGAIGTPRAFRAVGSANGANPVCLIVPCHRVIRADGTAGGYGGGLDRKEWLLEHEAQHS